MQLAEVQEEQGPAEELLVQWTVGCWEGEPLPVEVMAEAGVVHLVVHQEEELEVTMKEVEQTQVAVQLAVVRKAGWAVRPEA